MLFCNRLSPVNDNSSASGSESTSSSSEESNNGSTKNVETAATENNKWSLHQFIQAKPPVSNLPAVSSNSTGAAASAGLDRLTSPQQPPQHYASSMAIKHEPSMIDDDIDDADHRLPTFPPLKQISPRRQTEPVASASPHVTKQPIMPVIKQEPMGKLCASLKSVYWV